MKKTLIVLSFAAILLSGCAPKNSLNQYSYNDVGISTIVDFGTVITSRQVGITGKNSGAGGLVGAGVGAGAGSYIGKGSGNVWATLGGAVIGAAAGAAAEQAAANSTGIEYTVTTEKGDTMTIVQNQVEGEPIIRSGSRVMVQTRGSYQRVIPADNLPTEIKRPKGIKVVD